MKRKSILFMLYYIFLTNISACATHTIFVTYDASYLESVTDNIYLVDKVKFEIADSIKEKAISEIPESRAYMSDSMIYEPQKILEFVINGYKSNFLGKNQTKENIQYLVKMIDFKVSHYAYPSGVGGNIPFVKIDIEVEVVKEGKRVFKKIYSKNKLGRTYVLHTEKNLNSRYSETLYKVVIEIFQDLFLDIKNI